MCLNSAIASDRQLEIIVNGLFYFRNAGNFCHLVTDGTADLRPEAVRGEVHRQNGVLESSPRKIRVQWQNRAKGIRQSNAYA